MKEIFKTIIKNIEKKDNFVIHKDVLINILYHIKEELYEYNDEFNDVQLYICSKEIEIELLNEIYNNKIDKLYDTIKIHKQENKKLINTIQKNEEKYKKDIKEYQFINNCYEIVMISIILFMTIYISYNLYNI